jgi:uncharacterized protein (TIGR02246 family)
MKDAQATVEDFLNRFRSAWDAGDARTYAALFTEDATYVIFMGEVIVGRAGIERNHVEVFNRWQRGTKMVVEATAIQSLGADSLSVLTVGGVGRERPVRYDKIQTFTLVRQDGRWLCAAFHNTAMSDRARSGFERRMG